MSVFINEVGFYQKSKKAATVLNAGTYCVVDKNSGEKMYSGKAEHIGFDETAGDDCYIFDFSDFDKEGVYVIESEDGSDKSAQFAISENVYDALMTNLVKCLHYQRCGCALCKEHAGVYNHDVCHNDLSILLEDYISKNPNPKRFDATGGWHDAGDFGKYVSPAAVTVGHILYAYELFGQTLSMDLNIPESGNGVPDVLNEIRYELEWMLKMQTEDGGVYHKVTTWNHVAFMMPEFDKDQMIIYPVSSLATADFAACMALVSRVYKKYDEEFASKALMAARKAFKWLENNEYIGFKNPEGSNTGEYCDDSDADERMWAAAEMLRSDEDGDVEAYKKMLLEYINSDIAKTDFGWTDVAGFTLLTVLTDEKNHAGDEVSKILLTELFKEVERLLGIMDKSGYNIAMESDDFVWGSNMVVTNRGMQFIFAAWLLNNYKNAADYSSRNASGLIDAARAHVNYICGRNALGRSYVTGFGEHAFRNPHNRTSACDGIDDPMPGWVSGGPFKNFMDADALKLLKKGTAPQKCHADVVGSYSTNEITIYWNSSMIFLLAGVMGLK